MKRPCASIDAEAGVFPHFEKKAWLFAEERTLLMGSVPSEVEEEARRPLIVVAAEGQLSGKPSCGGGGSRKPQQPHELTPICDQLT
jgi:hypothetical protein